MEARGGYRHYGRRAAEPNARAVALDAVLHAPGQGYVAGYAREVRREVARHAREGAAAGGTQRFVQLSEVERPLLALHAFALRPRARHRAREARHRAREATRQRNVALRWRRRALRRGLVVRLLQSALLPLRPGRARALFLLRRMRSTASHPFSSGTFAGSSRSLQVSPPLARSAPALRPPGPPFRHPSVPRSLLVPSRVPPSLAPLHVLVVLVAFGRAVTNGAPRTGSSIAICGGGIIISGGLSNTWPDVSGVAILRGMAGAKPPAAAPSARSRASLAAAAAERTCAMTCLPRNVPTVPCAPA